MWFGEVEEGGRGLRLTKVRGWVGYMPADCKEVQMYLKAIKVYLPWKKGWVKI